MTGMQVLSAVQIDLMKTMKDQETRKKERLHIAKTQKHRSIQSKRSQEE